jgi:AmmeMemoRadiSam system protein B
MEIRMPAVAGQFYPASAKKIRETIETLLRTQEGKIDRTMISRHMLGGIVPHAGYIFSGGYAVHFFEILRASKQHFDTIVIVNPNHTGYGPVVALDENEAWETPLGQVPLDTEMMDMLPFPRSSMAHLYEHSGEVMLPFLQYFLDQPFRILPVTFGHPTPEHAGEIASSVFRAAGSLERKILFIASSDFSHFLSPEEGKERDELVVREILAMNTAGVARQVHTHGLTVCGYGPIMALMEYARMADKNPQIAILSRGHSGEVVPSESVVDYITFLVFS